MSGALVAATFDFVGARVGKRVVVGDAALVGTMAICAVAVAGLELPGLENKFGKNNGMTKYAVAASNSSAIAHKAISNTRLCCFDDVTMGAEPVSAGR